jgi:UDP-N-acetylglucosamine 4,6-dehydratase (inverting)
MKNKVLFITGGTGSFGTAFVKYALTKKPKKIIIFSRDESKQWDMNIQLKSKKTKFVLGDIRDFSTLRNAMKGADIVIHAAATKIVPTAETNPLECIKTNIIGTSNVIEASKQLGIKKIVGISTDKACNPVNLYGATKLAADKLFVAESNVKKNNLFSVVRYGNVIGSRGSVIPFFKEQSKKFSQIPITDLKMTRFIITLNQAVKFVDYVIQNMQGGEIFVKKLPSIKILDIAKAVSPSSKIKLIGIRPGEKLYEQMISVEDSEHTYEFKDHYRILPTSKDIKYKSISKRQKVKKKFSYSSNDNKDWMDQKHLKIWLKKNPDY